MHLLYLNIAPDIVSLWLDKREEMQDIGFLADHRSLKLVNECLQHAGSGMTSEVRKPRGLHEKGNWKAAEWKCFVLQTSLAALHDVAPKHILGGWSMFVQLCELLARWELTEEDVDRIERLALSFFKHYQNVYYKQMESRIPLCRFIYHPLLHLASCTRECGPLSLLAQWSTEYLIGDTNRRCHAKNLSAESVARNFTFQVAVRLHNLGRGIFIKQLHEPEHDVKSKRGASFRSAH